MRRVSLRGLANGQAEAEKLGIGHEGGRGAFGEAGESRNECATRRGADTDLRLAGEIGHREPSAVELAKSKVELDAELIGPEVGVRADEMRLLNHARMVGAGRDSSSVALRILSGDLVSRYITSDISRDSA